MTFKVSPLLALIVFFGVSTCCLGQTVAEVRLCFPRPFHPEDCQFAILSGGQPRVPRIIGPSQPLEWVILARIIAPDSRSFGIAGFTFDLVADEIPQGSESQILAELVPSDVPLGMEGFSRPLGISNMAPPAPSPWSSLSTGYGGTPMLRPEDGKPALVQIGGAQNTFGVAGVNIGQQATVTTQVGMDYNTGVVLASGTFLTPIGHYGLYRFALRNVVVNVMSTMPEPGQITRVVSIPVDAGIDEFGLICLADYNGDGHVTVQDMFDFLSVWFNSAGGADFNDDGQVTVQDVFEFIYAWFTGC